MRIEEIMSRPVITCNINDTLNSAAYLMWEHDCGAIPLVNDEGRLAGIVTDRDICMATYSQGSPPQAIPVLTAMARDVSSCQTHDSVELVGKLMREKQIRRIPVVDEDSRPVGLVSLTDIARVAARSKKRDGVDRDVVNTLTAICEPRACEPQAENPTGG